MKASLIENSGQSRCWWCGTDELYRDYHDSEWGRPVNDDQRLFEKICLEGFQAGLSWITILRKRENFRKAFKDFDFSQLVRFNQRSVDRLLRDEGIVRHRGKIESVLNNARRAGELVEEYGSLATYFWQFECQQQSAPKRGDSLRAESEESKRLSKDLKRRGWSFVGPVTCYAFMQSMGLLNDHIVGCFVRNEVELALGGFQRPA